MRFAVNCPRIASENSTPKARKRSIPKLPHKQKPDAIKSSSILGFEQAQILTCTEVIPQASSWSVTGLVVALGGATHGTRIAAGVHLEKHGERVEEICFQKRKRF